MKTLTIKSTCGKIAALTIAVSLCAGNALAENVFFYDTAGGTANYGPETHIEKTASTQRILVYQGTVNINEGAYVKVGGDSGGYCNFIGIDRPASGKVVVGNSAYLNINGGTVWCTTSGGGAGILAVGNKDNGVTSSLTLNSGTLKVEGSMRSSTAFDSLAGGKSSGTITINGGEATVGTFYLGSSSASSGTSTLILNGGKLTVNEMNFQQYNGQVFTWGNGTLVAARNNIFVVNNYTTANNKTRTMQITGSSSYFDTAGYAQSVPAFTGTGKLCLTGGGAVTFEQTSLTYGLILDGVTLNLGTLATGTTPLTTPNLEVAGPLTLNVTLPESPSGRYPLISATSLPGVPLGLVKVVGGGAGVVVCDGNTIYLSFDPADADAVLAYPAFAWWTGAGDVTDLSDPANWACTNSAGTGLPPTTLPFGNSIVMLSGLTLGADSDWSAFPNLTITDGSYIDLNGHNLKISRLTAEGGSLGAYVTNSVAGVKPALWTTNVGRETDFIDFQKVTVYVNSLAVRAVNEGNYSSTDINMGSAVDAEFVQTGDSVAVSSSFKLGTRAGVKGTYEVTGGTFTLSSLDNVNNIGIGAVSGGIGHLRIGGDATVNFNVSALLIGTMASATGRVEVADNAAISMTRDANGHGGWVNIAHAANSCGEMALSGGTLTLQNDFNVGVGAGSVATCDMSGGTLNVGNYFRTGILGSTGTFNMRGGTVNATGESHVGNGSGSVGTFNMRGGTVNATGTVHSYVGNGSGASGTFNMDGGKMTIRAALWVGYNGGTGTFNMSNGTLTVNGSLVPASKGTGRFFQGGGTVNANNYLTIGHNVGDGAYTITGGTLFVTNQNAHAIVGQTSGSKGLLDIAGGEAVIIGGVEVGNTAGASATLRVRNGGRLVTPRIYKGSSSATAVEFDGGTVVMTNGANAAFLNGFPNVVFKEGGVTLDAAGLGVSVNNCVLKVTPGATAIRLTGGGTLGFANTTLEFTDEVTDGFVLAQATGESVFTNIPSPPEGLKRFRVRLSADGKTIRVANRGFMLIVK